MITLKRATTSLAMGMALAVLALLLAGIHTASADPGVIYVDADAPGPAHDGLSWTTAYTTVQDALAVTVYGDEIWVAEGVYTPGITRTATFTLVPGVALYGGFGGYGISETLRTQRDWVAHVTILSGDIDGNDTNTDGNYIAETWNDIMGDNAYHVVIGSSVTQTAVLDGFTITAGWANGSSPHDQGGGMHDVSSKLMLANITFSGNAADGAGGGIYNAGILTLTHSTLLGNSAGYWDGSGGGGIYNYYATLTVYSCTLSGNSAGYWDGSGGGGIYNNGSLTIYNSTLSSNSAQFYGVGGGIYTYSGTLTIYNSTLSSNSGYSGGGIQTYDGALTIYNGTLSGNSAYYGAGIYNGGALSYCNTLIANSSRGEDCYNGGNISININNWVEDRSCSTVYSGDPKLGPLVDNDGGTWTHALLAGSLAIDAGDESSCLPADQRGVTRPQGPQCDIGAYEAPPMPKLSMVKLVTPSLNIPYHSLVTYTIVLSNTDFLSDTNVWVTDTLPVEMVFAGWIEHPVGAVVSNSAITWKGPLTVSTSITFTFRAMHTGGYGETVVNTAEFSGTFQSDQASATLTIECLPAITVQNTADSGPGSLRAAIIGVCNGGAVSFGPDLTGQTITLTSQLDIAKDVAIDGSALSTHVRVSGNNTTRGFVIAPGFEVTLAHLDIVNGNAGDDVGGGIYNAGTLTLTHSALLGNLATSGYGGGIENIGMLIIYNSTLSDNYSAHGGGGIFNHGTLTIYDSTLSGNKSGGGRGGGVLNYNILTIYNSTFFGNSAYDGGGIYHSSSWNALTIYNSTLSGNLAQHNGGGILSWDTLTIYNSTLSGNSAYDGGGILSYRTLTVYNSTFSGNSAYHDGGGIYKYQGTLDYRNTLIADSPSGRDCYNDGGNISTNINNLVEDGSCSATYSGDPKLGLLADNLGDTWTHALLAGSPAIDAGDDTTCLPTDQRSMTRPQGPRCDIGAYEAPPMRLYLVKSVTPSTNVSYHGLVTYTVVLSNTGPLSDTNVWVTDTLPTEMDFAGWVEQPVGAAASNDVITWSGPLTDGAIITFTFHATHAGGYGETVTNTAVFRSTFQSEQASTALTIECLPAITVQNAANRGPGSLRAAIVGVCNGGMVSFEPDLADQTITLTSQLNIVKDIVIDGSVLDAHVRVSGNNTTRVFSIVSGVKVTLIYLDIVNGNAGDGAGGGIWNEGMLTLTHSTLAGNSAYWCGGICNLYGALTIYKSTLVNNSAYYGGGIVNVGTLTIYNSTLLRNSASEGGGVYNEGMLTIYNSTLSGNSASYRAGGIFGGYGTLTIYNSTLSYNSAGEGGGILNYSILTIYNSTLSDNSASYNGGGIGNWGTLDYRNTLIANSSSGGDCYDDSSISASINNLVEDGSCFATYSGDPKLGPLTDNGGETWTHALLAGSLAIDVGDGSSCLLTDQRGMSRPQGAQCDIGAYEALPMPRLAMVKLVTPSTNVPYHSLVTYTIVLSNTGPLSDTHVSITDTLPAEMDFAGWIEQPAGAIVSNDVITWIGLLTNGVNHTFTFQAMHTGGYGETVSNTAAFSGTLQTGSAAAAFTVQLGYTLTVHRDGDGTVTSVSGIACGVDCSEVYAEGTVVTLTATPSPGWTFAGWDGDLSSSLILDAILMDSNKAVTVTFSWDVYALTVNTIGSGAVEQKPLPPYHYGDVITLTAMPVASWHFGQWSGDATGVLTQTAVLMNANKEVTATFLSAPPAYYTLTMHLVGNGVITPSVGAHNYLSGTVVQLGASSSPGWQFIGWSGDLTGDVNPAMLTLDADKEVTATFILQGVNTAPDADAGVNQIVKPGVLVTLNGSASNDADGNLPLAYLWRQTAGSMVTFASSLSMTTFTAPITPTVLTFALTVTDSLGLADPTPDVVTVTIEFYTIYLPLILKN